MTWSGLGSSERLARCGFLRGRKTGRESMQARAVLPSHELASRPGGDCFVSMILTFNSALRRQRVIAEGGLNTKISGHGAYDRSHFALTVSLSYGVSLIAPLSRTFRIAVAICSLASVAVLLRSPSTVQGPCSGTVKEPCVIHRSIQSRGHRSAAGDGRPQTATTTTGSMGPIFFRSLNRGVHGARRNVGYDDATFAPFLLKPGETKRIDLQFGLLKSAT